MMEQWSEQHVVAPVLRMESRSGQQPDRNPGQDGESRQESQREWILRRNCSISPRQLLHAYGALCAVSFTVAAFFTWHGAWYVLCFALVEMAAVGLAFVIWARHATDRERIALGPDGLLIELTTAEEARQFRLDPRATRIEVPVAYHRLIAVEEDGIRIEIGRFLTAFKRRQFAQELRSALVVD